MPESDVHKGKRTRTVIKKQPSRLNNNTTTNKKKAKSSIPIKIEAKRTDLRQSKRVRRRIICEDDSNDDDENGDQYVFN